ncbi:LIM domain only protein 7 isoform X4 [Poecilia reticulata]|uniref:LIM domain only protein 7 isoform X4 n=1 Tax=Poecilia reticulata TaxID=8081 RepID=UPI0007EAB51B|nr:PREDICTED: LIM domain only protein 7 isoform X4 [Poecilia reticulata]
MMEWREQSSVSSEEAYLEAQRWIEAATKKKFGNGDFRSALENGVLLCDLINKIKPGTIKRVNRLPTPIAGLDNLNVFLKACGKLGLKEAQLFHPGDLQDLSTRVTVKHQETNRRLKNVLITIYWLGRRAQSDRFYDGPYLNFKAFEGLLGTALYKALQESNSQKGSSVRDSGFGDSWYSERVEIYSLRGGGGGGGGGHRRDDSLDSLDSLGSRPHSISSDATLKGSSEGCCSDTEADSIFRMADKNSLSYRRSLVITPKASAQFNQFLPTKDKQSGYVPAPLRKKRAERNEDSRRSWTSSGYGEDEATLTRQQQTQESSDGSKSTSDIQVDPSIIRQNRFEELQKYREQIKDSEDKWQDDLSKWKNRRRSVNSDIVKKKEEREKIEQVTYGSDGRSKSFKEIQDEREPKKKHSIGSRLSSLSYLDDDNDNLFEKPVIRAPTRSLPPRSYTIDVPSYSPEPSKPSLKAEDPPVASPRARRQPSPPTPQETVDGPAARNSITTTTTSNQPPAATSYQKSPAEEHEVLKYTEKTTRDVAPHSSFASTQKELEPRPSLLGAPTGVEAPSSSSLDRQPQSSSMEPKPPAVSRVSASLPRSYQRSDSARLTSVVAPRPFGTQPTRISSLSRAHTTDESHKGVNGNVDVSKKASVPSRYHQYMTSEDEAQSSSAHSSDGEEEEEEEESATAKGLSSTQSIRSLPSHVKSDVSVSPAPGKETSKEDFCEMRISLNQKPNSSRDFGFQAAWDSTGAQVTSIQPGSSAEMCQLQVGDEVLTVNGLQVAQMSYEQWKSSLEEALQKGSLVMDVRRHGQHNWDRDQPSLPFKSHKTINLTSTDHPILLGPPETKTANSSLDFTSRTVTESVLAKEAPTLVDVASNRVNGDFQDQPVTMRNKESEPISLKNLKRRSEFFEQGGSESAMPDIPVPAITPVSSSRWSWNPEEERKRQEKWQKEQELLLQEKYKRDQEKLQEEWLKAQQEIVTSVGHQQVNSHSASPHSPRSSFQQPTLWEEEERQRKVEQERQRQAEERRRREEEERDLQRLQEERKRREMQAEEERMRREMQAEEERMRREMQAEEERKRRAMQAEEEREKREVELRMQRTREEELRKREEEQRRREEERRQQEAVEQQRRQKAFEQQRWAAVSHDFDSAQPPLSFIDRTKSQSSPQLDDDDKPQRRGLLRQPEDLSLRLLEEELTIARRKRHQSQKAASELEWRNSLRYAEAERAMGSSTPDGKSQQSLSQAELERQQILNEMKKKTPLLTDSSWIRQRSVGPAVNRDGDVPPMRRGESLDNLDSSYDSRRSSWTPRSSSFASNYSRPYSGYSGSSSFYTGASGPRRPGSSTLPPSFSSGSLHGGAGTYPAPWSRPSSSHTTPSPITSPEPAPDAYQQRNSASTASPTSEARRPGPKSEYETSNSSVTPATCESKLASQHPCDAGVLQQIDEETTCDNNP